MWQRLPKTSNIKLYVLGIFMEHEKFRFVTVGGADLNEPVLGSHQELHRNRPKRKPCQKCQNLHFNFRTLGFLSFFGFLLLGPIVFQKTKKTKKRKKLKTPKVFKHYCKIVKSGNLHFKFRTLGFLRFLGFLGFLGLGDTYPTSPLINSCTLPTYLDTLLDI